MTTYELVQARTFGEAKRYASQGYAVVGVSTLPYGVFFYMQREVVSPQDRQDAKDDIVFWTELARVTQQTKAVLDEATAAGLEFDRVTNKHDKDFQDGVPGNVHGR